MKLIYLGTELDSSKEHDLNSETKYGFNVKLTYTKDCSFSIHKGKQIVETYHNLTQVHNRFKRFFGDENKHSIAFESDIHETGCHRELKILESVVIKEANRLYTKF